MVTFKVKGDYKKAQTRLQRLNERYYLKNLDKFGELGVQALSSATPVDTGLTASAWFYTIEETKSGVAIIWRNANIIDYVSIALILQYGHATGGKGYRGYVRGVDYINPAMRPVFDKIAIDAWKEVTNYTQPIGVTIDKYR